LLLDENGGDYIEFGLTEKDSKAGEISEQKNTIETTPHRPMI
jgi:hypothetical protein